MSEHSPHNNLYVEISTFIQMQFNKNFWILSSIININKKKMIKPNQTKSSQTSE